jgi:hypothetical protein
MARLLLAFTIRILSLLELAARSHQTSPRCAVG